MKVWEWSGLHHWFNYSIWPQMTFDPTKQQGPSTHYGWSTIQVWEWSDLVSLTSVVRRHFHYLTSVDHRWPLTRTKNNRDHLLTMGDPPSKYENDLPLRHWLMSGYKFFSIWPVDLRWPLTWTKNNRDRQLIMGNLPSKYENDQTQRYWLTS